MITITAGAEAAEERTKFPLGAVSGAFSPVCVLTSY